MKRWKRSRDYGRTDYWFTEPVWPVPQVWIWLTQVTVRSGSCSKARARFSKVFEDFGNASWLVSIVWKLGTTFVCVSVRIPSQIWIFGKGFFCQQAGVAVVIYEPVFSWDFSILPQVGCIWAVFICVWALRGKEVWRHKHSIYGHLVIIWVLQLLKTQQLLVLHFGVFQNNKHGQFCVAFYFLLLQDDLKSF